MIYMWYMIITCFDTQRYQDFVSLRWRPTSKPWSWMYMMRLGNPWIWRWISVDLEFGCVSLCFFFCLWVLKSLFLQACWATLILGYVFTRSSGHKMSQSLQASSDTVKNCRGSPCDFEGWSQGNPDFSLGWWIDLAITEVSINHRLLTLKI